MNPLQINYFMTVAHYKSFTVAARELHVSQPSVSKQISLMEEEFKVKLFSRDGKATLLTPAGKIYHDFFYRSTLEMQNIKRLTRDMQGNADDKPLSVRIVFFIDWDGFLFMSPLVEKLRAAYPLIDVDFENRGISDIAQTLTNSEYDLTMCFDHLVPQDLRELLCSRHVADVHRMVYLSSKHPLASKEGLSLSDLKDETCVALKAGNHPEPERTIRAICAIYGVEPKFAFKPNHDSVVMCVQCGRGYCIFDEWSRNRYSSRFRTIPLDFTRPVSIYWQKDNDNPIIPVVVDILHDLMLEWNLAEKKAQELPPS